VWAGVASRILPAFTRATGAELAPGVRLLVRARPEVHPVFGLSLVVDTIDPSYTLGELEARRREIRARLKAEGLFGANQALAAIWDFNSVLVLAPSNAAGLGDFQAEAERLERAGLCRFVYVASRFQGEGAPGEMLAALRVALGKL
jgi:exodeoxyribonuclease VII large subunit